MALSFLTRKNKISNLIFKDHVIRYAELKQESPLEFHEFGEHYLPAGIIKDGKIADFQTLKQILEQCIDEWKLHKRQVRFLVPDPYVIIRRLTIPKEVKDDEIEGYLYLELGVSIHLPFEDPVFDVAVIGETEDKQEILLFAAPEDVVAEYSELLEACRLVPAAADISPLSLYRLYYLNKQADPFEHLLLLQLDLESMNASIFAGGRPVFMRHIPLPDNPGEWDVELSSLTGEEELGYIGDKELYMEAMEDLYLEIDRVLDFYKYSLSGEQDTISNILLTGDHPFLDEIAGEIAGRVSLPVTAIRGETVGTDGETALPARYYTAAGLALKGVK